MTDHPDRRPSLARRLLRLGLALTLVAVACWLGVSFWIASALTARPRPIFDEPTPEVAWAAFEPLRIATSDGEDLGAWYAEGQNDDAPSVLLLHPNGGSRRSCLSRAELYASEAGCSVLLISLRAHGDSTGDSHDIGFSARRDVLAGVEFLRDRRPDRPILVHGVSLGSAAATFAAADLGDSVAGYVLESPFRDLSTAVRNRTRTYLPPVFDLIAFAGLRIAAPIVLPDFRAIAPIEAIKHIPEDVPVLILAGDADPLATADEARDLFEVVRSHARIEIVPGAGHNDLIDTDPDGYRGFLLEHVDTLRVSHSDASPETRPERNEEDS